MVVVGFVFGAWDISDGFEDSTVVEPFDVFDGGENDGFHRRDPDRHDALGQGRSTQM